MEDRKIVMVKSDREKVIDLVTSLIGLAALAYAVDPEPFDNAIAIVRARFHFWMHRLSVWEAKRAIQTLPETDEP